MPRADVREHDVEAARRALDAQLEGRREQAPRLFGGERGVFGAMMQVASVNDGPFTVWLEREPSR